MPYTLTSVFVARPAPSYDAFAHAGGLLLLPGMYGTDLAALGSAWWSDDGAHFVAAPLDGTAVKLSATPEVRPAFASHVATPTGLVFCRVYGFPLATLSVGPVVRLTPADYTPPPESLTISDLVVDDAGTWWLSGYPGGDEAKGRVYSSPDGKRWTLVVGDKHWVLARIVPWGKRLLGLHYKQFSEVTPTGLVKLGNAKTHLDDVVVTTDGTLVAVGEGTVSVLAAGAKRTQYASCPVTKPVSLLAVDDGVLLGGQQGLFHAAAGLEWKQVSPEPVKALVSTKSGPVMVSHKAEVFALRPTNS